MENKELSAVEKLRLKKKLNEEKLKKNSQINQSIEDKKTAETLNKNDINPIVEAKAKDIIESVNVKFDEVNNTLNDDLKEEVKSIATEPTIEKETESESSSNEAVKPEETEQKIIVETTDKPDEDVLCIEEVEDFEEENLDELLKFDEESVNETVEKTKKVEYKRINEEKSVLFEWAEALAVAILIVSFIFIFIIRIVSVSGESMLPTLENGDRLIISKLFYTPEYKDVVVLTKSDYMAEPMVKRIIATEGQSVDIDFKSGHVYVDGVKLDEEYINEPTYSQYDVSFPQVVPEGHVFVMGDNRNHSSDSRVAGIGMVSEDLILGEVIIRLFPYSKIGAVE